jgi:Zn-dependent protease with chaperone function
MIQTDDINCDILSKKEIKKCRHKAEVRWYRRLIILNIIIIVGITLWFLSETSSNKTYLHELQEDAIAYLNEETTTEHETNDTNKEDNNKEEKFSKKLDNLPSSLKWFASVLGLLILLPLLLYYAYASYRSMSVEITEKNFPEIYDIVKEYSKKLGMKKIPTVYLVQGNGILNAFASCIPFKQYIELYADLVEVAYREHHDMQTLRFIIGHEISHIYLGHAKLYYSYSILFANLVPVLSATASRAREYSCDRIGQLLSGNDGIDAMMTLTAGIHLYQQIDKEDYMEHAKNIRGLFVWCYNLVSSHPVMSKRVLALDMKEGSGKLY